MSAAAATAIEEQKLQMFADLEEVFGLEAITLRSNDDGSSESDPDDEFEADVDTLDALLSESLTLAQEQQQAKAKEKLLRATRKDAEERLRRGGGSDLERAMDKALVARVAEALGEWRAVANVGVFHRHNCQCGSSHAVFVGLMISQEHFREKGLRQIVTTLHKRPNLPDVVLTRDFKTESCSICASSQGWDFQQKAPWSF